MRIHAEPDPHHWFNVSMLSRSVEDEELNGQVEKCRSLMTRAKENKYVIKYKDLGEMKDLELYVFSDAAYENQDLDRVKSTVGVIIFLNGPRGCASILWRSRAIKRVCKSQDHRNPGTRSSGCCHQPVEADTHDDHR